MRTVEPAKNADTLFEIARTYRLEIMREEKKLEQVFSPSMFVLFFLPEPLTLTEVKWHFHKA